MLKRNLLANYSSNFVLSFLNVICTPIYIKFLGVEFYGLVAFYIVVQNFLALLDMGMTPSVVREMASFSGGIKSIEQVSSFLKSIELVFLAVSISMAVFLFLNVNSLINSWLDIKNIPQTVMSSAVLYASIWVSARFLESFYKATLIGLQDQVWLSKCTLIIQTTSHLFGLFWISLISSSVVVFFIIQLLFTIVTLVVYRMRAIKAFKPSIKKAKFSIESIASVGKFGLGAFGTKLLSTSITQADKLLLSKLLSLENFGIYMLAVTATNFLSSIIAPLTQATYPKFIQLASNGNLQEFTKLFHNATQFVILLALPITIVFVFFPNHFVHLWLGKAAMNSEVSMIMIPLAIGTFFNILMSVSYQIQLANSIVSIGFFSNLVVVIFLIPALYILVPIYGAISAAWIWSSINILYFLIIPNLVHSKILKFEKNSWYWFDILIPVIMTAILGSIMKYCTIDYVISSRYQAIIFLTFAVTTILISLTICLSFPREIVKSKLFSHRKNA